MNVIDVYNKANEAINNAREGKGPSIIECKTYRFVPHSKADREVYRTKEEVEEWKKKCPIKQIEKMLIDNETITDKEAKQLEKEAKEEVMEAVEFAMNSEEPDDSELLTDVFCEEV